MLHGFCKLSCKVWTADLWIVQLARLADVPLSVVDPRMLPKPCSCSFK